MYDPEEDFEMAWLAAGDPPAWARLAGAPVVLAFGAGAAVLGLGLRGWDALARRLVPRDVFLGGLTNDDIDAVLPHEEE